VERQGDGEILISPVDVVLDPERPLVIQPDLLYVSAARSGIVMDRVYGAPDMAMEVLSPNPRIGQLTDRIRWLAQYGVREVWVHHQFERRLDIIACEGGEPVSRTTFGPQSRIRSSVLPHFAKSVSQLLL
jgi:Uma2 family endonuclease